MDLWDLAHRPLRYHHVLHVRHATSHCPRLTSSLTHLIRSAKFLASIVISDPRVRTYADIGKKAFGVRSMPLVNFMFCFETFSVG